MVLRTNYIIIIFTVPSTNLIQQHYYKLMRFSPFASTHLQHNFYVWGGVTACKFTFKTLSRHSRHCVTKAAVKKAKNWLCIHSSLTLAHLQNKFFLWSRGGVFLYKLIVVTCAITVLKICKKYIKKPKGIFSFFIGS